MPVFTKRPVDVEARRFDGSPLGASSLYEWMIDNGQNATISVDLGADTATLSIVTREGNMKVSPGDWVLREPAPTEDRKFYPCKPDIFDAAYDRAMISEPEYATVQELTIVAAKSLRWWENAAAAAGGAVIGSVIAWSLLFLP